MESDCWVQMLFKGGFTVNRFHLKDDFIEVFFDEMWSFLGFG